MTDCGWFVRRLVDNDRLCGIKHPYERYERYWYMAV